MCIRDRALDGTIRPIYGALPATILARELGMKRIFLPIDNTLEAVSYTHLDVYKRQILSRLDIKF